MKLFRRIFGRKPLVVLIRGGPSAGKTTIAHLLTKRIPNTVRVSVDNLVNMNVAPGSSSREWANARPLGHELSFALMRYLLSKNKNVVVDEVFLENKNIAQAERIAKDFSAVSFVFELEVPLEEALNREKIRPYPKEDKPVKKIMQLMRKNPYPGAIKIETAEKSPDEIVAIILKEIGHG